MLQLKMLYYFEKYLMSLQHNVHSKPPVSVSVLHSIAPLSPALFLYRYYVRLCPSIWLKLGLLWLYLSVNVLQTI